MTPTPAPERNPDGLTPEQYGAPEWRLLEPDEVVREGDEVWSEYIPEWVETENAGMKFTPRQSLLRMTYRRRVAPEPSAEAKECPESPDGEHHLAPYLEFDASGRTIVCEHCGEPKEALEAPTPDETLKARVEELEKRAVKAEAFKAWVHDWLDKNGVPHDPDPEHTQECGCRINGRMAFLRCRAESAEMQVSLAAKENAQLVRERDEARAWQEEIRGAIERSGMGIMRTSQGPSGTMLGYRPEVEEEHNRKTLEVIHENVDLSVEVQKLRTALAECERDKWQPIETAPKDGGDVLLSNGFWVFEATSLSDGRFIRTKDGQQTAPSNCRFWKPVPQPPVSK